MAPKEPPAQKKRTTSRSASPPRSSHAENYGPAGYYQGSPPQAGRQMAFPQVKPKRARHTHRVRVVITDKNTSNVFFFVPPSIIASIRGSSPPRSAAAATTAATPNMGSLGANSTTDTAASTATGKDTTEAPGPLQDIRWRWIIFRLPAAGTASVRIVRRGTRLASCKTRT